MNGANGMSDIEGKAARVAESERGREGVSIMKDETKATHPSRAPSLSLLIPSSRRLDSR